MEIVLTTTEIERYPTYKDSEVDWLGEIPAHWELLKSKHLWKEKISLSKTGAETLLSVSQYIGVNNRENDSRSETLIGYKKVSENDLVINIMLAWLGGLGLSQLEGVVSPAYAVYELLSEADPKFLHYLYRTNTYLDEFARRSKGVVPSRWRMYTDDFGQVLTLLPPLPEQTAIALFLDRKTAQIDNAIRIKERQIELLQERRQILIHRAVTRGLDPKVPLKDSGVDWIGEIPAHWEVKALKFIAHLQSGETISAESFIEEGYPVFGGNGFRGYASTYTNDGEFALIGRQGALCGNINYASGRFYASEHAIVVYPLNSENTIWLGESIRVADFNRLSQSAAQPGIAVGVIKNVKFPYPPITEQHQISQSIKLIQSRIDNIITTKQQEIEKLKEYKGTLINSAVTGKIKVG